MNYNKNFVSMQVSARHLMAVGVVAGAFALALPALASAATYAYVDQSGFIRAVEANDPYTAIATAPNIDEHSGVALLSSLTSSIVGGYVQLH